MTISVVNPFDSFTGNGTNKTFSYTFAAFSAGEVAVEVNGVVIASNLYTVTLDTTDYQGGTVLFTTAPANAAAVVLYANPSFLQEADLDNVQGLLLSTVETALDKATVRSIYLKGAKDRSLRVPHGEVLPALPNAATRASKAVVFDATGLGYSLINPGSFIGATGPTGSTGAAATITVGSVTTLAAGASATVVNAGTSAAAVFNFGLPAGAAGTNGSTGATGTAATVAIGSVTTLAAGSSATATNVGTSAAAVINFGIPQGANGSGSTVSWGGVLGTLSNQTDLQSALNLKATLASPTFTGVPAAPTAAANDSTTQLATTAFVTAADNLKATILSPTLTGTPAAPTAAVDTSTTQLATTAYVVGQAYAKLASPTLTGTPAAPTATAGTNTTQLATTAFVVTSYAPLASPTFTGTASAPTPSTADNTTKIATTAYVQAQGYALLASPAFTGTPTTGGIEIGFRSIPVVTKAASFIPALTENAKGFYYTGGVGTLTINPVATTAYPVGSVYTGFNGGTSNLTLTRGAGVTLYKNGAATSADVVVAAKGRFTIIHWATDVWTVDGTNLT